MTPSLPLITGCTNSAPFTILPFLSPTFEQRKAKPFFVGHSTFTLSQISVSLKGPEDLAQESVSNWRIVLLGHRFTGALWKKYTKAYRLKCRKGYSHNLILSLSFQLQLPSCVDLFPLLPFTLPLTQPYP